MGIKITESEGFQTIPMGQYQLVLTGIEWYPSNREGWADQLAWKFATVEQVNDDDGEPVEPGLSVWGWSTDVFSPKSRAWAWAAGLLDGIASPASLVVDGELEPAAILGRVATVKVNSYQKDGETKNSVLKEDDAVSRPNKKYSGEYFPGFIRTEETEGSEFVEEEDDDIPF